MVVGNNANDEDMVRKRMAMRGCAGDSGGDEGRSNSCADENSCGREISFQTSSSYFLNQQ